MRFFSILLAIVLPFATFPVASGFAEENAETGEQVQCEEKGGKWAPPKAAAQGQCNLPTLDAGRICNDSTECESACVAESSMLPGLQTSGVCYGWSLLEAECVNPVARGVTQGNTCDD